ncbi:putative mucin family signaling protein Msb2 [Aspergillus candidus]|uniref:Mucin family signaling protein Msb2 n=1 Tax=Aspergillus candidus TaxID=41067 RepID=A0A2I2FIS1_ASPCN|nr:hypothetical protein BDW47DRAFT_101267 [Aspergillus candidus]PLB40525.1 hypothetical protein BDW47DRAFT_101267 [Aspergillus candidus]
MVASVASFLAAFLSVGGLELVAAQQPADSHAMKRRFVPKHMKRYINYQRSEDGKPLDDFLDKADLGTKTTLPAVVVTLSIDKEGKTHTISGPLPAGATIASATTNVVTITGPGAAPAAPTSHKDTVPAPSEKEAAPNDSTTHHAPTASKEGPDAPAASSSSPATESKDGGILDDVKNFFGVSSSTDSTEASSTTSDSKPAPSSDSKAAASSDSKHAPSDASSASVTPTPESTEGSFLDDVKSFFGDTSSTDSASATSSASDSKPASSAASGSSITPTASSTDGGLLDDFKSFFGDSSSTGSPSSGTPPALPLSSTADASTTKAPSTSTPGASSSKSTTNLLDAFTDLFNPDTPSSSATHAPSANASTSGLSATPTSVPLPSTSTGLFNLPSEMSSLLGWTSGLESSAPQSTLPPGAATSSALFPGASSGSTGSAPFTLINPSVPTTTPGGASSTENAGAHGSTTGGSTAPPTAKPTGKPTSPGSPTSAPSTAPPTHLPSSTSTETPTPTPETTETSTPPPETTEAPTPTSNPDDWVDNTIIFETQTHVVPDPSATQTTSESTSQPTALPGSITPPTFGNIPENSTLIQLGFTRELSYDFVATHTMSSSQIFRYIPLGLQHALRLAADQVAMFAIQPYGNESRDGYLTTLAMAYVPWDQIDTLRKYLHNPISPLYEQPSESEKRLFSLIDPSIPLLVSGEPAAGGSSGGQSGSSNGGSDGSDGDDSQSDSGDAGTSSSSSTKASSVGIGCGVVAGAAAYGAGMFWLARRYRKKRQLHQRSSSTVDQQSEGRDAAGRLSPNSQSSRGPISAPVMAENSLGWN